MSRITDSIDNAFQYSMVDGAVKDSFENFHFDNEKVAVKFIYKLAKYAKETLDNSLVVEYKQYHIRNDIIITDGLSDKDIEDFLSSFPKRLDGLRVSMGALIVLEFKVNEDNSVFAKFTTKGYVIMEELRELCIKKNWFTRGTNHQYKKLFDLAESGASIHDLALIIWLCSDDVPREEICSKLMALGY